MLLKAGFTTAVVPHQPSVVRRLPLQTPVESPSHAAVLNPSWFCQDFSFFHPLFDKVLCEGGGESWNMRATFKLLSYFKERFFGTESL